MADVTQEGLSPGREVRSLVHFKAVYVEEGAARIGRRLLGT
jgi:hypothetical protein